VLSDDPISVRADRRMVTSFGIEPNDLFQSDCLLCPSEFLNEA
jgi:hypothetical protein